MDPESKGTPLAVQSKKPILRRFLLRVLLPLVVAAAGSALVIAAILVVSVSSVGHKYQDKLNTAYRQTVQSLQHCKAEVVQEAGFRNYVADTDRVLTRAVAGKYGTGANIQTNYLFEALQATTMVPITGERSHRLVVTLALCQQEFLREHQALTEKVADFKSWRTQDWLTERLGGGGFPDDGLMVQLPAGCQHGQQALDLMELPVADTDLSVVWKLSPATGPHCDYSQN